MELKGNQHLKHRSSLSLPKEDQRIPDFYKITIELRNGVKREIEAIQFRFIEGSKCFEIRTVQDEFKLYPLDVVTEVTLDENYTKLLELHAKKLAELEKEEKSA